VICDVTSGAIDAVASGPTVPDPTTYADCLAAIQRRDPGLPDSVVARLARGAAGKEPETPKPGDERLAGIDHELLAAPSSLARAAVTSLQAEGLRGIPVSGFMEGDVAAVAKRISTEALAVVTPCVLVFAGEPTVRPPPGAGRGGRMQHLALLLAKELMGRKVTMLCAGSDGRDGDTDHAGACVDGATYQANIGAVDQGLIRFDSAASCTQIGAAVPAWPTGTNLTDLVLVAVD
jgi:glycerate 2-kinase